MIVITIENLETSNDVDIAIVGEQESGSARREAGHKTGPPLRYKFSMSYILFYGACALF